MTAISSALSALDAFSIGMQVTAHNVANVNTNNFAPQRTTFSDQNPGVKATVQNSEEFNRVERQKDYDDAYFADQYEQNKLDEKYIEEQDYNSKEITKERDEIYLENQRLSHEREAKNFSDSQSKNASVNAELENQYMNTMQVEKEMANAMFYSNGFDANVATIHAQDEMLGAVLNTQA